MIRSRQELIEYMNSDNDFLKASSLKGVCTNRFILYPYDVLRRYLVYLRKQEYYMNTANGNKIKILCSMYYERKKNKLGQTLGIDIGPNCFGKGLSIWHYGSIVVNPEAKIGEYCTLHGGNCIGNNGSTQGAPIIGSHVDIGYGAVIIGDIEIANHVKIGANAVVTKSILEEGCTAAGVPAKIIH